MESKKIILSALAATVALSFTACGGSSSSTPAVDTCVGSITASGTQYLGKDEYVMSGCLDDSTVLTLDAANIYAIKGEVSIKNATLTIPQGTTLFGQTGQSYLAIDQGAKIIAEGTETNPIVFTSLNDVDGTPSPATAQGEWGGLSIFGYAEGNKGLETYEAGDHTFGCDLGGAFSASQGGTVTCNDADNSGTLEYVVIKHSGFEVETDKELNGLSLGGVGSGTTIDHVAVIGSLDDGIEVWGGKVNMTNLYIYNNADDSLDWDHGWTGSATNVYVEQVNVDGTGSRGFETDNNGGSTTKEVAQPISNPTIDKFTIITAVAGGQGVVHREGTAGQLSNGIIITKNDGKANIEIRSANTVTNGLAYSGAMVLSQDAGLYYKGAAENLTDSIFGDVTDAEVQAIVEGATVVTGPLDTLSNLKTGNPTVGSDALTMPAWAL